MKYALFDTDFISKTHTVRLDEENHLIDRILEMPEYIFYCHEQTIEELSRHNSHAPAWLEDRIKEGRIIKYTDEKIIDEMSAVYSGLSLERYVEMLKTACEAFGAGYFSEIYSEIKSLDCLSITKGHFLKKMKAIEKGIGTGKHLGEIKCYVLLQWLNLQLGDQLYYFCSDDKDARDGILGIEDIKVRCITLVSSLLRIHIETGSDVSEMNPYIQALLGYFSAHDRETIRVVEASSVGRIERVACEQVLTEIFEDKFIELPNGFLKYRLDPE